MVAVRKDWNYAWQKRTSGIPFNHEIRLAAKPAGEELLGGIHMLMKRYLLLLFGLSLLLAGCNKTPSDAVIRQQIVGAWTYEQNGAFTFTPDGSWSILESSNSLKSTYAGTWQIQNGILTMMMTNASSKGGIAKCKILRVDNHQLVFQDVSGGKIETHSR